MTPEKQRIAIAEAMGFTKPKFQPFKEPQWLSPKGTSTLYSQLPNYLTDLNVMHEAEKALSDGACQRYIDHLVNVTKAREGFGFSRPDQWNHWCVYHATSSQRAEAFLRSW